MSLRSADGRISADSFSSLYEMIKVQNVVFEQHQAYNRSG